MYQRKVLYSYFWWSGRKWEGVLRGQDVVSLYLTIVINVRVGLLTLSVFAEHCLIGAHSNKNLPSKRDGGLTYKEGGIGVGFCVGLYL
jgi:hypothetical protein